MEFEKREYQEDSFHAVRNSFKKGYKKVLLTMPTGSGKSHVGIRMIKQALERGKRVGFIADVLILIEQFSQMLYNEGVYDISIMQADNPLYHPSCNMQVISAQTLARRKLEPFDLMLVDECHIVHKSVIKLMKEWNETFWVGMTASPFTRGLGKIWETTVNGISTAQLIKDGYLSEYIAYGPTSPDLKGVRTSAGDYNRKDLGKKMNQKQLVGNIVEHWVKLAHDRKTVVGAVNIAHAQAIADEFKQNNIEAKTIHCYLPKEEIKETLESFKNGDFPVLSSVNLVSRGFDMPSIDCLVIARPTKSLNYHLQFLGRGLRPSPTGRNLLILDHSGNLSRLGFPDDEFDMTLDMGIKKPKKQKKKLPKPCPECYILFVGQTCPSCGYTRKKKANVTTKEGELKELQKGRHKKATPEKKERLYAQLLAGAKALDFKEGWAAYRYREYYGVFPARRVKYDKRFYNYLLGISKFKRNKIVWGLTK